MALAPGTRLGPYEIQSALGAGGMGEVYKARDTRLDRTVAVKVLPEHVASDPQLKQRFEAEARTLAALSHPHICPVFDVGEQEGVDFLVMEYLEGETLAERLTRGALPIDHATRYAIEIADALDKAHRTGIVHRDLKPGNIMLTKSGTKLLDFGLAKLKGSPISALSAAPTQDSPMTLPGTILGTMQYMAPEQLEGGEADARTDIFAFGAVVYEMATGRKAFEGNSQARLIGAILKDDPQPISSLQPMSPQSLDLVVRKCLSKDPDERWHTAHDLHDALQWIADAGSQVGVPVPAVVQKRARWPAALPWIAGIVAASVVTGLAVWSLTRQAARSPTRFEIPMASGLRLGGGVVLAFSPDGRTLVYLGPDQLYRRDLEQLEAQPIPETENALIPFFSPDGQWLGFNGRGGLRRVALAGGPSELIVPTGGPAAGGSWGPDNTIVFGALATGLTGLSRVSANGGESERLTTVEEGENLHVWPDVLPSGDAALFTVWSGSPDTAQVAVVSLETGERRTLVGGTQPRYVRTGHIVFARGASLWAVPFDAGRLEVTGAAAPVLEGVGVLGNFGAAQFAVANDGTLAYVPGGAAVTASERQLVWVDRQGREEPVAAPARTYEYPRLSPDGMRVALEVRDQERDIWIWDLMRETLTRLTFDPSLERLPAWSPDGRRIAYSSQRDGSLGNLFWQAADGTGAAERLAESQVAVFPTSFSPDASRLLVSVATRGATGGAGDNDDIAVVWLDKKGPLTPLLQTSFGERNAEVSPDGRWLAYESGESGQDEIYVRPFPDVNGGRWQVSTGGGTQPAWAASGRELFYRSGAALMAVSIQTTPTFTVGNPALLFEGQFAPSRGARTYDVSPDGERFLMIKEGGVSEDGSAPAQIIVVQDWFEELRRLVPTN